MTTLEEKLNELWEAHIESYNFDLINLQLVMQLKRYVTDTDFADCTLEFHKVSTVYFVNGFGEGRKRIFPPYEEGSWLELTSIGLIEQSMEFHLQAQKNDVSWFSSRTGGANIVMEIWGASLFLECESIIIDGEEFIIDESYPPNPSIKD